jgi:hypothetical protein
MRLVKAFSYEDPEGTLWEAPAGRRNQRRYDPAGRYGRQSGRPFVGNYRRATIVHDYFVGELSNPDVSPTGTESGGSHVLPRLPA